MENYDIGNVISTETREKNTPYILILVSIIFSLILLYGGQDQFIKVLCIVIAYWILLLTWVVYRLNHNKITKLGQSGMVIEKYAWGKLKDVKLIRYSELPDPKFKVTDHKVNGSHSYYLYEVDFGAVRYCYHYDFKKSDKKQMEYRLAHKLYRLRNIYLFGRDEDYDERYILGSGMWNRIWSPK